MQLLFSHIALIVIITSLYVCLEGFLFLHSLRQALVRGCGIAEKIVRKIHLWVYWPLSLLVVGLYFYSCYSSDRLRNIFGLLSAYWGLFFFIPFLILADILNLGGLIFKMGVAFSLWVRIAALVLAGVTLALGSVSAYYAKITNYSVTIEKDLSEKGIRIVLISDIHLGGMVRKKELARLVSQINSLNADLVLIAGDIIDRDLTVYKKENLNEELSAINATLGVYAAAGNHDYFGGNINELERQLAAAGIKLLLDEVEPLNGMYIIGRKDFSAGRWGEARRRPLKELVEDLDTTLPLIVIDHQPFNLGEAEDAGIDLQVSGHTHRGQIWPGPLVTNRIYENDYGLHYKGKTAIVVTSGCGTWGPPVRIGSRSEIVLIELKN